MENFVKSMRDDASAIIWGSIRAVSPEKAVQRALENREFPGDVYLVAIGKAAWNMAKAASDALDDKIKRGIVVTKYGHSRGAIAGFEIVEAGHPIPDENSVLGATKALELVSGMKENDRLLFLISGGGSALFEKPLDGIFLNDIQRITDELLRSGAGIVEMNTVRKHLSAVKGGRLASCCVAKILAIVLSDVIGDPLDAIASGPAYADLSTSQDALNIIQKYHVEIDKRVEEALKLETPKTIANCETVVTGNVTALCDAAAVIAQKLGYQVTVLSQEVTAEARDYGRFLASKARELQLARISGAEKELPVALISGGETVVQVRGKGRGGRNQELALSAAIGIEGMENVVIFSVGSDGTDGPTDAAGGLVDGSTTGRMRANWVVPENELANNNSYEALKASGDLVVTGPTGTNVNDLMVVLCR